MSVRTKTKINEPYVSRSHIARNYLDWMTELPWSNKSKINTDLMLKILDEDHMVWKVKERIIEFLAVQKNKRERSNV